MRTINVTEDMSSILLGRYGEHERTQIVFDVSDWLEEYPGASISLYYQLPKTFENYPVVTSGPTNGKVTWTVSATELRNVGTGKCELVASKSGTIVKGRIWNTQILEGLDGEGDAPDPWDSWMTEFSQLKEDAEDAAEDAEDAKDAAEAAQTATETARDAAQAAAGNFQDLSASVTGLAAGTSPTVNVTHSEGGYYNLAFGIPKGDKGDQGNPAPAEQVTPAVNAYLEENFSNPSNPPLDRTLLSSSSAAPADMVGVIKRTTDNLVGYMFGGEVVSYTPINDFSTWNEKSSILSTGQTSSSANTENNMYCDAYLSVSDYAINGNICFYDRSDNNGFFVAVAFYDSSKTFLSRVGFVSGSKNLLVQIPANSAYFRIVIVYKINGEAVEGTLEYVPLNKLYLGKESESDGIVFEVTEIEGDIEDHEEQIDKINNSLLGGEAYHFTSVKTFNTWNEKASITNNGQISTSVSAANNMYCDAYFSVSDYVIDGNICFYDGSDNNGFFVAVAFYNSSKTFLSRVGFVSGSKKLLAEIPSNAEYFRIVVVYKINGEAVEGKLENVPLDKLHLGGKGEYDGIIFEVTGIKCDNENHEEQIDTINNYLLGGEDNQFTSFKKLNTWNEKNTITAQGNTTTNSNNMYCDAYLSVSDYAINGNICFYDKSDNNGFFIAVAFYNSSKTFLSRVGFVSGTRKLFAQIPSNAAYFRIVVVYKINGEAVEGKLENVPINKLYIISEGIVNGLVFDVSDLKDETSEIESELSEVNVTPYTMDVPPTFISNGMTSPGQGMALVDGHYIISDAGSSSYDSAGSTANIRVYNSSFTYEGNMSHNLGHGTGICYNALYDVFLMGNGEANVSPRLDILLNASANVQSAISNSVPEYTFGGSNVMSIYLTKDGHPLVSDADGAEWCVAGNDRLVLISVRNESKERIFFLGMLGAGSTDFSLLDNGYGTFVSGKTSSELNGTIKILKKFEPVSESIASAQGMSYDKGKLIVSSSTSNCMLYKIGFFDEGYKIIERFKCSFFNADGTEQSCEPEGVLHVGDGHFYCATTKGVIEFYA